MSGNQIKTAIKKLCDIKAGKMVKFSISSKKDVLFFSKKKIHSAVVIKKRNI